MKKVKDLCLLIFLIIPFYCHSQIEVRLYGKNKCSDKVESLEIFALVKDSVPYHCSYEDNGWITIVPDTGVYRVIPFLGDMYDESFEIYVKEQNVFVDTLQVPSMCQKATKGIIADEDHKWYCCDQKCNGYQADYYINGNMYMEGYFKKGKAIGEIKFYNREGILIYINCYNKRGKYTGEIKYYNIDGTLNRIEYYNKRGGYRRYIRTLEMNK